ncbi:MAG: thiolase family protein [Actinomycetota bacterium]|jgi:acetyl-CoA acetyltransferase family protein|tara:strand:- start:4433 stop:5614 length:1182 start_codon:yes stop_codon:yes gene_type:complete
MNQREVIIAEAVRTPFGRYFGGLSKVRPDDLLGFTLAELAKKLPNFDLSRIDDVIIGDSNGAGEDNRNVARMGLLLAGFPQTIPGVTVNRLCGSGAEGIIQASRAIRSGDSDFIVAGGVEVMSRAPWIVERTSKEEPNSPKYHQSTVGWRMTNPLFPSQWTQSLGRCSEEIAERFNISRQSQDEWSHRSHQRAAAAWEKRLHDGFVTPFGDINLDESIRADGTLEKLAELPSVFSETGAGTAGNSSPLNDGSVAMLITDSAGVQNLGLEGVGRIVGAQVTAMTPNEFSLAPITAIHKVLARTGKKISDVKVWEINEAFASMVLSVLHEIPEIDTERVNVNGGAIAIGHPVGASAARVIVDCARELKRQGGGIGIAAACIGVGLGVALVVEVKG